jgi:hypothetical protein
LEKEKERLRMFEQKRKDELRGKRQSLLKCSRRKEERKKGRKEGRFVWS